ncbi:hypothetical protein GPP14_002856 [Salmonella enterica]|nr:hypothetical protein [Salmonella enterica]
MAKAPLLNLGDALLQGAKEPSSAPAVPIMPTSEMPTRPAGNGGQTVKKV